MNRIDSQAASRREFLRASAAAVPAALAAGGVGYAAGSDVIRVGMIGCGGRCTEAATQAMNADRGVRLVAMCDIVMSRLQEKRSQLRAKYAEQMKVDDDHCFAGFDAYKKVIDASRRRADRQRGQVPPHARHGGPAGGQARLRGEAARHRPGGHQGNSGRHRAGETEKAVPALRPPEPLFARLQGGPFRGCTTARSERSSPSRKPGCARLMCCIRARPGSPKPNTRPATSTISTGSPATTCRRR